MADPVFPPHDAAPTPPLEHSRRQLEALLEVSEAIAQQRDLPALFHDLAERLHSVLDFDFLALVLHDPARNVMRLHVLETRLPRTAEPGHESSIENTPSGWVWQNQQPFIVSDAATETRYPDFMPRLRAEGVQSFALVPLTTAQHRLGALGFGRLLALGISDGEMQFMQRVASQVAVAVDIVLAFKEIDALKNKLAEEKLYLEEEIRSELNFEEIIGDSPTLKRALAQVELVAPAGTTVLITGETGTGKELIARAIHNLSPRRLRTFVKINCAAIPSGLLESELFGHERGAFTGAISQKIGRFELADHGTLFLDEVADLPLDLQPKLLRVLQEQEFERLGSNRTQRVDVRVVAATNTDLGKLAAQRAFRSDLYYRLNVFPIHIPALRERPEDVPLLVRYFVQKFSRRLNKSVEFVPADAMDALVHYPWPGNVRELENFIERAVLLSPARELRVPVTELKSTAISGAASGADPSSSFTSLTSSTSSTSSISTLEEAERQHILRALRQTHWRIAGPRGAAVLLGMKRTTLQARLRKLNIRRPI
jgi:formate hydrogenlyase transcriptional activator